MSEKSSNFTTAFAMIKIKKRIRNMNNFQQKLLSFSDNMAKACERVCKSEVVSELDVDVLRQKMREMYDFLLTAEYQDIVVETPCLQEPILEIEPKIEQENIEPEPEEELIAVEQEEQEEIIPEPEQEEQEVEEEQEEVAELEMLFEEPEPEPESMQTKTGSVLDYLHNNIMKDNEPKPAKKEEYTTLDLFKSQPSIAEAFENKNRSDLRTAIGVSEKFMFINDLFSGDLKAYTNFINMLNDATSVELSLTVIEENRIKRKWIKDSLAYTTLENLVQKRFKK